MLINKKIHHYISHRLLYGSLMLIAMLASPSLQAQDEVSYYDPGHFRYTDHIYSESIHTVLLHRLGWELSYPAIELGSSEKLLLSFDDLQGGRKVFRYTLIHCDAAWKPSDMLPSDYLEGFFEDFIHHYQASYNTIQSYTHYSLEFPSEAMRPLLSGNYIIKVWESEKPDEPILSRRFMIFEQVVSVSGRVHAATDINDRNFRQEIDFHIDQQGYTIDQPFRNLHVVIQQNGRWDNAITNLKPMMVKGSVLDYDHDNKNVFDGVNEFRRFDLKSLKYNTENVESVLETHTSYTARLKTDRRRPFQVYTLDKDINGQRLIKVNEATDSGIEAEYVNVEFSLAYDAPLLNGSMYVLGALTYWQPGPAAKMNYDMKRKAYTTSLYLKQGYYNYCYLFMEDGKQEGDATLVEGSHEETENDYTILVYNRETGSRYDRLIAMTQLNSLENR